MQTFEWLLGSHRVMERCRRQYGDVFTLRMVPAGVSGPGARPNEGDWVFLADPDLVREVFSAGPDAALTGPTNRFLEGVVGSRSILLLDEPEHMVQRRLLLPPFHGDRVAAYRETIAELTRTELARWPIGGELALWPRMQAITLAVIVRVVFGVRDPERGQRMQELLRRMLNRLTSAPWVLARAAWSMAGERLGAAAANRRPNPLEPVDRALEEEIRRRRAGDEGPGDDVLSDLMEARYEDGSRLSDAELRDELITLLIAGHESTATELAWAFERLLRHPEKLERLRAEAMVGEDAYADAVVTETLRLRPVLPVLLRELAEPFTLDGWELPAGTWVAPCGYLIHRRADIYPEPLAFRPERFLERKAGTYTWIPFGGGVRRCVGAAFAQLEIKQVLQSVLTELELEPVGPGAERIRPRFITHAPSRGARARVLRPLPGAGAL